MNLEGLNKIQQEAVQTTEGRVRVIAGAGSGKTRAIAYRYAYLVNEVGIDPGNILCLTFTNKAAREMKSRIAALVPAGMNNDFICTIHGFCVKFLREEIFRLGYPKSFSIIDEEDMTSLAKEVLTENGIDRKEATVRDLLEDVSRYKSVNPYIEECILPGAGTTDEKTGKEPAVQFVLKQKKLLSLDFSDLLHFTYYILNTFAVAREQWQSRFQYVMVDEVQDCTPGEWDIFTILSDKYKNLFIVGDPDQSIYEWRGATPEVFVDYKADKDIIMAENYRSTSIILDAANSVITNNQMRVKKDLYTKNPTGCEIIHFHAPTEKAESDWIAKKIVELKRDGSAYSDIAILYRASYLSRSIEQALMNRGVSYVIWGGIRFFERKEIKDAISYLRLISAPEDNLSFKRICNVPSRKIGKVAFQKIQDISRQCGCSLYEALKKGIEAGTFKEKSISGFVELVEECRRRQSGMTITDLLDYVLNRSGLNDLYRTDGDEERLENIAELVNSIKNYEEENKEDDVTLQKYLQDIALYTNLDYQKDTDRVKLMTIHQAKGLEFPYVFVSGLSEGIFPNPRSIRENKERGLEEERRLMYVAVTRAEKALFLTESEGYSSQANGAKVPSRFIREIRQDLYVTEGKMDASLWNGTDAFLKREQSLLNSDMDNALKTGDSVTHGHFGNGIIVSVNDGYAVVKFDDFGERRVNVDVLNRGKATVNHSVEDKPASVPVSAPAPVSAPVPLPEPNTPAFFEYVIRAECPQYTIRKDIPVTELVGNAEDRFRLYETRPEQVYKAEWGKPYDFVLYQNGKPAAVVMLGDRHTHNVNVKYLIARMYAKKLGLPYINFYTQFPNTADYVARRLHHFLGGAVSGRFKSSAETNTESRRPVQPQPVRHYSENEVGNDGQGSIGLMIVGVVCIVAVLVWLFL